MVMSEENERLEHEWPHHQQHGQSQMLNWVFRDIDSIEVVIIEC